MVQGAQNNVGAKAPLLVLLPVCALVGAIWGLLQMHVLALFLFIVGRVTTGPATFRQVRMVLAWAEVPHTVLVACWLLGAIVFGRLFFLNPEGLGLNPPPALLLGMLFVYLVSLVAVSWSLVILVKGLAEAQGISAWAALGSLLLAGLILGVSVVIVLQMVVTLGAMRHPSQHFSGVR